MKGLMITFLILILCLPGCKTEMNNLEQYVEELQASTSSVIELKNATALNDYATDQHLTYSVEIWDLESSLPVRLDELERVMNKKLSVTISVPESDFQAVWKPVDNSNIFILLRE